MYGVCHFCILQSYIKNNCENKISLFTVSISSFIYFVIYICLIIVSILYYFSVIQTHPLILFSMYIVKLDCNIFNYDLNFIFTLFRYQDYNITLFFVVRYFESLKC